MKLLTLVLAAGAVAVAAPSAAAVIVDYSPNTLGGPIENPGYANIGTWQNFVSQVTFGSNVTLTGMDVFSEAWGGSLNESVTIKIYNGTSAPTTLLTQFNDLIDAIDSDGTTLYPIMNRKYSMFDVPVNLVAGTYWIGMTSTFGNLGQGMSQAPNGTPTAMVLGTNPLGVFGGGNSTAFFRLYAGATATPEPGMIGLLGFGLAGLALARRRRRTA
jgi:hypothetical protein